MTAILYLFWTALLIFNLAITILLLIYRYFVHEILLPKELNILLINSAFII